MWTCPKCGRSFKNNNQEHYCGSAPKDIEEYILRQDETVQQYLNEINDTIKNSIPETIPKISWSMPTYWKGRNIIQFAAFKKHIGIYPGPDAVKYFEKDLTEYKTSKGAIQIPYKNPLPLELISKIAKWCENNNVK